MVNLFTLWSDSISYLLLTDDYKRTKNIVNYSFCGVIRSAVPFWLMATNGIWTRWNIYAFCGVIHSAVYFCLMTTNEICIWWIVYFVGWFRQPFILGWWPLYMKRWQSRCRSSLMGQILCLSAYIFFFTNHRQKIANYRWWITINVNYA